jgi:SapC protein
VTNIVPLDKEIHRGLRVQAAAAARYGDNQRFVPVIVGEFPHLVVHCPILLSKDAVTGGFYCGAMLGFDEGENLFLKEGEGHDGYRPLSLQRMPFYASGGELAIDLDHPRVAAADGPGTQCQSLFTEQGEPSRYLRSIVAAFAELTPGIERTKQFIDTLIERRLVEPVELDLEFDDGTALQVTGLYTIAQDRLRELSDATVVELFRRGYLKLIYLMIASLKQVPVLAQRKNDRLVVRTGRRARG